MEIPEQQNGVGSKEVAILACSFFKGANRQQSYGALVVCVCILLNACKHEGQQSEIIVTYRFDEPLSRAGMMNEKWWYIKKRVYRIQSHLHDLFF